MSQAIKLGIIGLGYVGLPLAVEFGKKRSVIGFDINLDRIEDLSKGYDSTHEVDSNDLHKSSNLKFTNKPGELKECNFFIVTVPTPIDDQKKPDLRPLLQASKTIGKIIKKGDVVVFESTVYPGVTEEECVPVIERQSKLKLNNDFHVGYSPERINPGDKKHNIANIVKITSGSSPEVADIIDNLYKEIIVAGTHQASSIKVAEAAKVIENTQRDLNIALVNELALIFNKMNIDTSEVLEAARTKWNFMDFRPGLVGGHCIGVDPYYLTHKAQLEGYSPEIILAGRKLNDMMSNYVVSRLVKKMTKFNINLQQSRVIIFGATFKENCPDLRNSKVLDIISELLDYKISVEVFDPWIKTIDLPSNSNIKLVNELNKNFYDAAILAVPHKEFLEMDHSYFKKICKKNSVVFDLKSVLPQNASDLRL
jgi:UDP-N-acetyl-D-glucosamine/UDP-N-acetyl-D-galactosamine dehydrogenase